MAYEGMTYENILHRMMDTVTTLYPNIDTREGSIIFNALAPAALELAIAYTELDNTLNESFVNTASRDYLLIACEQMGMDISTFDASFGEHKGVFNVEVPIGSRWNHDLYNYVVSEYIGTDDDGNHEYILICETEGTEPNLVTGDLIAITYTANDLTLAKVTECLIEGEEETPDEDIRASYYDFVNSSIADGNVKQYERWCIDYDGIGNYKVIPQWDGENTVKVSILSASNRVASDELISEFQEYLDPGVTGMGDGVAPIGAFVTVSTATEIPIEVSATVTMKDGYSDKDTINDALTKYFSEIAYKTNIISYMKVGAVILAAEGVDTIKDLRIDGYTDDITLEDEQIVVLGSTNWG